MNTAEKIAVGDVYQRDGGHTYEITAVGNEQILVSIRGQSEEMMQNVASIFTSENLIERDGKEIPKQEPTLEERVIAEYGEFEVVMLEWVNLGTSVEASAYLCYSALGRHNLNHIDAQSMKGFAGYVYEVEGRFLPVNRFPTWAQTGVIVFPIGALFTKATS